MKISMRTLVLLGILIAILPGTLAAEKSVEDNKALQGVWKPVKAELAGAPMPEAVLKTITLNLKPGEYEVTVENEGTDKGVLALDVASNPKGMKITGVSGPNAGKTYQAIYELSGDTLRVCYDLSGTERPKEFKTVKGTQLYLVTYSRRK